MTWNYRIIKHDSKKPVYFAIHEVYYDDTGAIEGWTEEPVGIVGDTIKDLRQSLGHINKDTKQQVLKESEIEKFTKTTDLGAKT